MHAVRDGCACGVLLIAVPPAPIKGVDVRHVFHVTFLHSGGDMDDHTGKGTEETLYFKCPNEDRLNEWQSATKATIQSVSNLLVCPVAVRLSARLSARLPACPPACPPVRLPVRLRACVRTSACPSVP